MEELPNVHRMLHNPDMVINLGQMGLEPLMALQNNLLDRAEAVTADIRTVEHYIQVAIGEQLIEKLCE